MANIKEKIYLKLKRAALDNQIAQSQLADRVSVTEYVHLTRVGLDGKIIWSDALQNALYEHEIVTIPENVEPYYVDCSIIVPSNRRIEVAQNAVIQMISDIKVLLLRNEHTADGTNIPIDGVERDCNIAIIGGIWRESQSCRLGYGRSGMYDLDRRFYGVSTCMLFNNICGLTLKNICEKYLLFSYGGICRSNGRCRQCHGRGYFV